MLVTLTDMQQNHASGYNGNLRESFRYDEKEKRVLEDKRVLEKRSALDMLVFSTLSKKLDSQTIAYTPGSSKTKIVYIMVRNKERKKVRDIKVIHGEEVAQQDQLLL